MSSIPNLNTLRTSRAAASSRGRGRARDGTLQDDMVSTAKRKEADQDRIVQQTDQDASVSRLSAIEVGYLEDPFAKFLVTEGSPRRFPIINRGTYVRTSAIDRLTEAFLGCSSPTSTTKKCPQKRRKQIISLGAGSDTRYFRLVSAFPDVSIVYHELDFPSNTRQKISSIKKSPALLSAIKSLHKNVEIGSDEDDIRIDADGTALYSSTYNLHPIDLRTLKLSPKQAGSSSAPSPPPSLRNIDSSLPTLLISECCLIYLTPTDADAILQYFTLHLFPPSTPLGLIIYEPINPNDPFGRVMVQNLAARGIVMQTLKRYASLARQKERMRVMGFAAGQASADVDFILENWISANEKERVSRLEMLDEIEEWKMLAQHYCVAWAWRDGHDDSGSDGGLGESESEFLAWKEDVVGQPSDE